MITIRNSEIFKEDVILALKKESVTQKISKLAGKILAIIKLVSPLLAATIFDPKTAALLSLFLHSHTKLLVLSRLDFHLQPSLHASLYYDAMDDYLKPTSDQLASAVIGRDTFAKSKDQVCRAGLDNLCQLETSDGLLTSSSLVLLSLLV